MPFPDRSRRAPAALAVLSCLFLGAGGGTCREPVSDPAPREVKSEAVFDLQNVREIKRRHDAELMALPGVVGTGIAAYEPGGYLIEVYVEARSAALEEEIPERIEGVPVRIVETGVFEARPDETERD